ncbi:hypothetical protein DSECCO2_533920 [anaerobic digester metagenome]
MMARENRNSSGNNEYPIRIMPVPTIAPRAIFPRRIGLSYPPLRNTEIIHRNVYAAIPIVSRATGKAPPLGKIIFFCHTSLMTYKPTPMKIASTKGRRIFLIKRAMSANPALNQMAMFIKAINKRSFSRA